MPGEKQVKKWRREWKFARIEAENPGWRDLWEEWFPADGGLKVSLERQPSPGSSPG